MCSTTLACVSITSWPSRLRISSRGVCRPRCSSSGRFQPAYKDAIDVSDFSQSRQVRPPRSCSHQAKAHPSWQANRQRSFFRCPTRLPEVCVPILSYFNLLLTRICRHIDYALTSPYGGGRPGRVKRKRAKAAAGGGDDAEEEDEE